MPFPAYRSVMLDHTGGAVSSATTSGAFLIADLAQISLSVATVTTFASRISVQGCNVDGLTATIPDGMWSTLTALTAPGVVTIDPGVRWLRVASASSCTVELTGRIRS